MAWYWKKDGGDLNFCRTDRELSLPNHGPFPTFAEARINFLEVDRNAKARPQSQKYDSENGIPDREAIAENSNLI